MLSYRDILGRVLFVLVALFFRDSKDFIVVYVMEDYAWRSIQVCLVALGNSGQGSVLKE
jgi:hypothetical protein